jgi:hypothetical protein
VDPVHYIGYTRLSELLRACDASRPIGIMSVTDQRQAHPSTPMVRVRIQLFVWQIDQEQHVHYLRQNVASHVLVQTARGLEPEDSTAYESSRETAKRLTSDLRDELTAVVAAQGGTVVEALPMLPDITKLVAGEVDGLSFAVEDGLLRSTLQVPHGRFQQALSERAGDPASP